jgi:hypothetical protein
MTCCPVALCSCHRHVCHPIASLRTQYGAIAKRQVMFGCIHECLTGLPAWLRRISSLNSAGTQLGSAAHQHLTAACSALECSFFTAWRHAASQQHAITSGVHRARAHQPLVQSRFQVSRPYSVPPGRVHHANKPCASVWLAARSWIALIPSDSVTWLCFQQPAGQAPPQKSWRAPFSPTHRPRCRTAPAGQQQLDNHSCRSVPSAETWCSTTCPRQLQLPCCQPSSKPVAGALTVLIGTSSSSVAGSRTARDALIMYSLCSE